MGTDWHRVGLERGLELGRGVALEQALVEVTVAALVQGLVQRPVLRGSLPPAVLTKPAQLQPRLTLAVRIARLRRTWDLL